jgi:hypothetical protein
LHHQQQKQNRDTCKIIGEILMNQKRGLRLRHLVTQGGDKLRVCLQGTPKHCVGTFAERLSITQYRGQKYTELLQPNAPSLTKGGWAKERASYLVDMTNWVRKWRQAVASAM